MQITKADLLAFYSRIATPALQHIGKRPLTVVRCNGPVVRNSALRSQCEFVRHTPADNRWAPASVPRLRIREQKKIGEYLWIDSRDALLALVDAGAIEFHAWNATVDDVERPDRAVFDIDPGERIAWDLTVAAAHALRDRLQGIGLESWPKLTGGKGIHVVVPFERDLGWDDVLEFARVVAESFAAQEPGLYTVDFSRAARRDRILIDYKRNVRANIAVAAYSTRARPHAPVAVPVSWRSLTAALPPDAFTVRSPAREFGRPKVAQTRAARQNLRQRIEAYTAAAGD